MRKGLVILATLFLSGCGTVGNVVTIGLPAAPMRPYGGVAHDFRDIADASLPVGSRIGPALDLPLTTIADTLTLPFTISETIHRASHQGRSRFPSLPENTETAQ